MARVERGLGYAILGMITSPFVAGGYQNHIIFEECDEDEDAEEEMRRGCGGVVNKDGAWCWRDDCQGIQPPVLLTFFSVCLTVYLNRLSKAYKGAPEI